MRHVLSLDELTSDEIRQILQISRDYKQRLKSGNRPLLLAGMTMGMLFQEPSLRTRVSFESLVSQLGGASLFLGEEVGWGKREPNRDFVPILTSYLDLLVIRANQHADVVEAASFSRCPVINGLTNRSHPCQALADILTVMEMCDDLSQQKIAYLGDANNVAYSLATICSRLNVQLSIGAPQGYQFDSNFLDELNSASEVEIQQTEDPVEAVRDANFVYTDVWASMGQEAEQEQRVRAFAPFQVNGNLMSQAAPQARLLHCLPARRGEEVTSDVIDSPAAAIIEQAENRLHAQKGLVLWLLDKAG